MRKAFVVLIGLVVALTGLGLPATASIPPPIGISVFRAVTPGAHTQLEVKALSGADITGFEVRIRLVGSQDVFATVTDFTLVSGTVRKGVWRSVEELTVPEGRFSGELTATNSAGRHDGMRRAVLIDNGRDVKVTGFEVTPTVVDVTKDTVTFRGRVIDSAGNALAGVSVLAYTNRADAAVGDAVADSDGMFSGSFHLSRGAIVHVETRGDALYRSGVSEGIGVRQTQFPTRLTMSLPPAGPVVGDPMPVTGRLEWQNATGAWAGLGGVDVEVLFYNQEGTTTGLPETVGTTRTEPDGSYRAMILPRPMFGNWAVGFSAPGYVSSRAYDTLDRRSRWHAKITGVDASPEPAALGGDMTIRAHVTRTAVTGKEENAAGAFGDLQFSTDGKRWKGTEQDQADSRGDLHFTDTAKADGYWRVILVDPDYLPATSSADYVDVRYRTSISSFNASPEPVRKGKTITVQGTLKRDGKAYGKQGVKVYFEAKGSKKWTYAGRATTDKKGHFKHGFKAVKDGTWRVVFGGNSGSLGVTGPGDFVDVR